MLKYIGNWILAVIYLGIGLFMLWAGLLVLGVAQNVGVALIVVAGSLFTFAYVSFWTLIVPVIRWVRGRVTGKPYTFRERLRGF